MDPNATSGMNPTAGAGDTKPKVFDKEGAVGKQFTGMSMSGLDLRCATYARYFESWD